MFSEPQPSLSLRMLKALQHRKQLTQEESLLLAKYQRGYAGEKKLAALLKEKLDIPHIALHSLQLECDGNEFQIDCLLIVSNQLYILDSKNYYGDFYIENNRWYYHPSENELKNPLEQLVRCERLLKDFLRYKKIKLPLTSNLIFMDSRFLLYNASRSMPIIFPNQHVRFLYQLNMHKQPLSQFLLDVAEKLKAAHIPQSRHEYIPAYNYERLRKGVFCGGCGSSMNRLELSGLSCNNCGVTVSTNNALNRSIGDLQLLFPERLLTTKAVSEWIGQAVSKITIRRFLTKDFKRKSKGRGTYYG